MDRIDFAYGKFVYSFYSIHFFCTTRFDNGKPFSKEGPKFPGGPKLYMGGGGGGAESLNGSSVPHL